MGGGRKSRLPSILLGERPFRNHCPKKGVDIARLLDRATVHPFRQDAHKGTDYEMDLQFTDFRLPRSLRHGCCHFTPYQIRNDLADASKAYGCTVAAEQGTI